MSAIAIRSTAVRGAIAVLERGARRSPPPTRWAVGARSTWSVGTTQAWSRPPRAASGLIVSRVGNIALDGIAGQVSRTRRSVPESAGPGELARIRVGSITRRGRRQGAAGVQASGIVDPCGRVSRTRHTWHHRPHWKPEHRRTQGSTGQSWRAGAGGGRRKRLRSTLAASRRQITVGGTGGSGGLGGNGTQGGTGGPGLLRTRI